jgi:putative peptidoglycan lipid II flippase
LFEYGAWTAESTHAVATAIMIQVLVLPAMVTSQVYSKTLYAAQDVRTPVKSSVISLIIASVLYLILFPIFGYLAIPIGTVISGYTKNYLLLHKCKKCQLFKASAKTIKAILLFAILSIAMGAGLWIMNINSIMSLIIAILIYGILYLPIALIIDKKI